MVWKMMAVKKVMWRIFRLQTTGTQRIYAVLKIMLNLCALRWLRPRRRRVRNFNPLRSEISYILFWNGRIKDNRLHLNKEIDCEFLMLISKLNQSFRVEGKKELLKKFVRHLYDGILLFLVPMVGSYLGIKLIK